MKKTIFHIITDFDLGGAEVVAANICKNKNSEFKYHLIAVVNSKNDYAQTFMKSMESIGVVCHRSFCSNNKLGIILFPFWFLFLFFRYKPIIVHSHTEVPDLSTYMFNFFFGWLPSWRKVKIVRTIHNTELWTDWKVIGRRVEKLFHKKEANVSISISVQQSYKRNYGDYTPIIYNGVETKRQIPFKQIELNKINILFAGRFEEQKGIDQLVKILAKFKNDSRFFFHIVGNGSKLHEIKNVMTGMNNGRFYNRIFNLSAYLASFDYLLMPSNFEGLVLVSLEASMAKTPVMVNMSCPGLNETIPRNWPLAVQHNDINQWYSLIDSLDKQDEKALGETSYNFVKSRFTVERMQKEYEELYKKKIID